MRQRYAIEWRHDTVYAVIDRFANEYRHIATLHSAELAQQVVDDLNRRDNDSAR